MCMSRHQNHPLYRVITSHDKEPLWRSKHILNSSQTASQIKLIDGESLQQGSCAWRTHRTAWFNQINSSNESRAENKVGVGPTLSHHWLGILWGQHGYSADSFTGNQYKCLLSTPCSGCYTAVELIISMAKAHISHDLKFWLEWVGQYPSGGSGSTQAVNRGT